MIQEIFSLLAFLKLFSRLEVFVVLYIKPFGIAQQFTLVTIKQNYINSSLCGLLVPTLYHGLIEMYL